MTLKFSANVYWLISNALNRISETPIVAKTNTTAEAYLGENCSTPVSGSALLKRVFWALVQSTIFSWSPRPLHRWRAWLLVRFGAQISDPGKVIIFPSARITYPQNLVMEDRAMIGPKVTVYNLAKVTLSYGANVSQNCHLCAGTHDYTRWDMPLVAKPIFVAKNVWIAADVFVAGGVTIGELAVVGARSVVVKDLPPSMICVGNPCKPIKDRIDPVELSP